MKALLLALALTSSVSALAACGESGIHPEMMDCEYQNLRSADAQLNANYSAVRSKLNGNAKNLLRDAQRSWITYRDSNCNLTAQGVFGGQMGELLGATCLTSMTKKRAKELNDLNVAITGNVDPAAGNPQQLASADAQLNANHQAVRSKLDDNGKSLLRTAQLNWISYRDSNCAFKAFISARTQAPAVELGCKAGMTQSRSQDLHSIHLDLLNM